MKRWLDDRHDQERNPDVLLTDGTDDIAIEIKQLTDGDIFHNYKWDQHSLYRRLAPDPVGNYILLPPPSIGFRLDSSLLGKLKSQVAIAATGLRPGGFGIVLVPRRATVRLFTPSDTGFVTCLHAQSDDVRAVSPGVAGGYLLEDDGPNHQFLTEQRRLSFHAKLKQACKKAKQRDRVEVEWFEEWKLIRTEDSVEGRGGVMVLSVVGGFLEAAAFESVDTAICGARKKFKARKWARRSAVALHAGEQQHELSFALFESEIANLEAADVQPIDVVFLVDAARVRQFNFAT